MTSKNLPDSQQDDAFTLLKSFFTERKTSAFALANLRENVEIGIIIGGIISCAVFRRGREIFVEAREAVSPDFIFRLEPHTVTILATETPDETGEIGLAVIKEMLAGSIHVEMPGGLLSVLRNGYLEIVSSGGAPVARMLANVGLGSPMKIVELFRNLRR